MPLPHRTAGQGGGPLDRVRRLLARLPPDRTEPGGPSVRTDPSSPPIDIVDRGDRFVVLVDLPGFRRADIDVTVGTDHIDVVATATGGDADGSYVRRERRANRMSRSVPLPASAAPRTASTRYRSGVLQVLVPKADG